MSQHKRQVPEKGEGNHEADREYRERTERFVASGRVDDAATEAKRALDEEGEELEAAEAAGRARIAEEDPEVRAAGAGNAGSNKKRS
jgi:hypothetical protein